MNSTRAGLQLCWGLLALTGCAGGHTQPGPPPTPHGHTLMQWTAADNRVAWIVLDSASDLDGVNRQLVRDMSRDTQFIVITHSRRTMEAADVLYGVTMEEAGCSRLVSVNFADVDA